MVVGYEVQRTNSVKTETIKRLKQRAAILRYIAKLVPKKMSEVEFCADVYEITRNGGTKTFVDGNNFYKLICQNV